MVVSQLVGNGGQFNPFRLKEELQAAVRGVAVDVNPAYNLLLTANGLHRGVGVPMEGMHNAFVDMLRKPRSQSRVAHIINGGDREPDTKYMRWTENSLANLGLEVVTLDLTSTRGRSLRKALRSFDVVYMEGGNAFYLLKLARQSRFNKYLQDWLAEGNLFVGMCAGAKIVGSELR